MNEEQAKAIGLRAVACPAWRWLQGTPLGPDCRHMVTDNDCTADGLALVNTYKEHTWWMGPDQVMGRGAYAEDGAAWPDFRSPAAMGCLESLVREAIGPGVHATRWPDGTWSAMDPDNDENEQITLAFAFEAEALVVAMEAAPPRAAEQ